MGIDPCQGTVLGAHRLPTNPKMWWTFTGNRDIIFIFSFNTTPYE